MGQFSIALGSVSNAQVSIPAKNLFKPLSSSEASIQLLHPRVVCYARAPSPSNLITSLSSSSFPPSSCNSKSPRLRLHHHQLQLQHQHHKQQQQQHSSSSNITIIIIIHINTTIMYTKQQLFRLFQLHMNAAWEAKERGDNAEWFRRRTLALNYQHQWANFTRWDR
ncbi:hypothetical protein EJ04DRAFT_570746 [Polyplosphaeria fusca]|uniref:Uncharacterized protein n=1 Tax=Polyplosphaeria fusca TaxID=682080 RepID=A0A9P4UWC7_9PLEO|nr:hypothetical protein EJ04DRAFT_570746 [Polyplosphaeria fusca]